MEGKSENHLTQYELSRIMSSAAGASAIAAVSAVNLLLEAEEKRLRSVNVLHYGQAYTNELLSSNNPPRIKQCLRMELEVFEELCEQLRSNGGLRDTKKSTVEHQVHVFMYIISTDASNRTAQECFRHSGETISRHFHEVLEGILHLEEFYMKQPAESGNGYIPVPQEITKSPKYYPYFQNCIGALDGSLIPVTVPAKLGSIYRCRKGFTAQNILIACSFDFTFQYVRAGWPGSVHDSRILDDAKKKGFNIPDGKYYLADAGFASSAALLVPYRGIRYHLKEFAQANHG